MERTMFRTGLPPCRVNFFTSITFIFLPDPSTAKVAAGREPVLRNITGIQQVLKGNGE